MNLPTALAALLLATGITNVYGGAVTEPLRILACLGGAWAISWFDRRRSPPSAPERCVLAAEAVPVAPG